MYIGIDVGGTNIKAGVVDGRGNLLNKDSIPTLADRPYNEVIADMAKVSISAAEGAGVSISDIKSIGIGIPGSCDDERGMVTLACNLNFNNVPLRSELQKHIKVPVHLGNDANCAALGEYYMLDEKPRNMIFVTLGTGIGGGIIIDKKLYTGFNATAGEIGHIMLVKGGRECGCGRRGCWEAYGSVTGLILSTKEAIEKNPESLMAKMTLDDKISGRTAFDAAREGDAAARTVISTWAEYVAEGVIDLINLFQPEVISIGGAISAESDMILKPILAFADKYRYNGSEKKTRIQIASCGNDAGIVGAAFLGNNY